MQEIQETGIRGFLKWFATVQPDLYKKIAPSLSKTIPAAFSDYHAGGWRTAGLAPSDAVKKLGYIGELGASPVTYGNPDLSAPIAIDFSNIGAPAPVDVATAANQGGSSSSTTDMISSIVKGVSTLYLGKRQADIQQQVVNTQLQRAAMGLPPLPSSLSQLGVPQVNVGLSSSTSMLAIGGGLGLLALFAFMGKRGRR